MHVRFKYEDFSTAAGVACDERTTRWESRWLSAKPGRGGRGEGFILWISLLWCIKKLLMPLGTNASVMWFGGAQLFALRSVV